MIFTKHSLFVLLLIGSCISLNAQLKGIVFHDENDNGIKDYNERGVAHAVVSDGYHVMRTDSIGYFELAGWEKQRFVTLYPSANMQVSKRYIPVCDGEQYSFPVTFQADKNEITFLQISDTETFEYRDWLDQLKQYTKTHQPDFIVHTGDICYRSGMQWHADNLMEKQMQVPVYYCIGNHDLIKGDYGEQFFEQCFGPAWYAFEKGKTLYIVTPMMGGDYKPGFTRKEIGVWLKNLLGTYDKKQAKIIFNHDLLTNEDSFRFNTGDGKYLVLEDYNLKAWLYGHWHINMVKKHEKSGVISYGTSTCAKGGIDHSPSAFRVVQVDTDGNTSSLLRWTYPNREIEIVNPQGGIAKADGQGRVQLTVNAYHGGAEVDSVQFGIWGAEGFNWNSALESDRWTCMQQNSDWSWSASFQAATEDHYTVVVYAYLKSGDLLSTRKKFVIEKAAFTCPKPQQWYNLAGNKEHDPVIERAQNLPYHLAWVANLGSNVFMSSPVLYNDLVMSAGFDDGNAQNCYIIGWDAGTGKERWRYKTLNGVKNQMVIAQKLLIATDMQGITYAIVIETGELKWKKDLGYNRLPGFVTGLVTDGKTVYTGFGKSLCALDVNSGKLLWKNQDWDSGEGTTPVMTIADEILIVSSHWNAIYAHDTQTGKLLWSRKDDGLRFRDGVVSYKDGSLWVAQRSAETEGKLHQLDLKTGKSIGGFFTGMKNTATTAPIVLKDKIIIAASHPGIAAFERVSGQKIWEFEVGRPLLYTPSYFSDREQSIESTPMLIDDKLVFGAMDGCVYVLNEKNGQLLWKTCLGAPVLTTVAVGDNRIYFCDFAGNIYCFQGTSNK